jgi:hypothetical protein
VIEEPGQREILPLVPINPVGIDSVDVTVDPEHDRVYVANQGNVGSGPPSVSVIDRSLLKVFKTGAAGCAQPDAQQRRARGVHCHRRLRPRHGRRHIHPGPHC